MNGTSGVDVDPVRGEVYMCQQRGTSCRPRDKGVLSCVRVVSTSTPRRRSAVRFEASGDAGNTNG